MSEAAARTDREAERVKMSWSGSLIPRTISSGARVYEYLAIFPEAVHGWSQLGDFAAA